MENSGTEGEAKKKKKKRQVFKQDLLKLTLKAEVAHWDWPCMRALWSSAIKVNLLNIVYTPTFPSRMTTPGHPDFLPCPRHSGGASPRCVDAVLQLLVFGTLTIHTVV